MCDSISRVQDQSSCPAGRVETEDCLYACEQSRNIERLKEDLCRRLTIRSRIEGSLCEEDRMLEDKSKTMLAQ